MQKAVLVIAALYLSAISLAACQDNAREPALERAQVDWPALHSQRPKAELQ